MPKSDFSDAESEESHSSEEESEKNETTDTINEANRSGYEQQRINRIEENRKRMEALGLKKIACSLLGSAEKVNKKNKKNERKGKKKLVYEDEEYNPTEEPMSSSSEDDEEISGSQKKKARRNDSTPKKQGPSQSSNFVGDDDDALMQAIALSLQDSAGFLDVKSNSSQMHSKTPDKHLVATSSDKRRANISTPDDLKKKKRKKTITSRVQMSEDEMIMHFFQFDETGLGGISIRDLRRLATSHDFTWSEKEMEDMINCFDSDQDGKISLDDFRKIVDRCNMIKGSDKCMTG